MTRMLCRLLGHKTDEFYTQPEIRFERLYNKWLHEPMWYEVFDHKCVRCSATIRVWRWTKNAARKMLESEEY